MRVPIRLNDWLKTQDVGDKMLWKDAFGRQAEQLRRLEMIVGFGLGWNERDEIAQVISTHRSKSIVLPVVSYERPDIGLRFVVRDNFHNWKLSVISEKPIDDPLFPWLFFTVPPIEPEYTGNPLADVYFEGFPKDLIFGYQSLNHRRWSAEIQSFEWVLFTVFLCFKAIGAMPMPVWNTRESHRKQLEEQASKRFARADHTTPKG